MQSRAGNAATGQMLGRGAARQSTVEQGKRPRPAAKRPKDAAVNQAGKRSGTVANAYGTFTYTITKAAGVDGCDVRISFTAFAPEIDADKITLIQAIESHERGKVHYLNNDKAYYQPFDVGMYTDHLKGETDPFYNYDDQARKDEAVGSTGKSTTTMTDTPHLGGPVTPHGQSFETAAYALTGKDQGEFLGTLTWGWDVAADGTFSLRPAVAHDDISTVFGSALRAFVGRQHTLTATNATPAPVELTLPTDVCRELTFYERLTLLPTSVYAGARPHARVWVVARYTTHPASPRLPGLAAPAGGEAAMAAYNAHSVQACLVAAKVPADRIHLAWLEQPGVPANTSPVEVTVIDT